MRWFEKPGVEFPKDYNYDRFTLEYLGESEADPNPEEEGDFFLPAFATRIKPPTAKENEIAVWKDEKWVLEPDYRGETWYLEDGQAYQVRFIGQPKGTRGGEITNPNGRKNLANSTTIYQYYSMSTFISLIQNSELWLTEANKMNDPNEGGRIVTVINSYLKKNNIEITPNLKELFEAFELNHAYAESFLSCFSFNGDLLSQWRAYGDDGKGVSVGFDVSLIKAKNQLPVLKSSIVDCISILDVIYNEQEQLNHIKVLIDNYINKKIDLLKTQSLLNGLARVFKDPYYEEENEVRMILLSTMGSDYGDFLKRGFRNTKYGISPYYKYSFVDHKSVIKDIIVGPKNNSMKHHLEKFLADNGFDHTIIRMKKSEGFYR